MVAQEADGFRCSRIRLTKTPNSDFGETAARRSFSLQPSAGFRTPSTMDHLAATPVAPVIAAADPEARKKIGASVVERLQRYADNDGVTYAEETYVLTSPAGDHRHKR